MNRLLVKCLAITFLFLNLVQVASAKEKHICNSYNPQVTQMEATTAQEGLTLAPFKKIPNAEFKKIKPIWDHYCPECTLKDRSLCQKRPCQKYNLISDPIYKDIEVKGDVWARMAGKEGLKSVQNGGGPYGTVIVQVDDASGKVIRYWRNHNHVIEWNDPTAHAEVSTIRAAARELGVLDLGHINQKDAKLPQPGKWSHCVLYTSVEPCPMCMGAAYWAGIKELAFGATRFDGDAEGLKFSDHLIYKEMALPYNKRKYMNAVHFNTANSLDAFNYYKRSDVKRFPAMRILKSREKNNYI